MVGAHFRMWCQPDDNLIPVITSVKQLDSERVEIIRHFLHKRFFNTKVLVAEEQMVVSRKGALDKKSVVLQTKTDFPGLKTEAMKLFGQGYQVQRCMMH